MKILVMSDSHGSKNNMLNAIEHESPDWILHLGDNERDCSDIALMYPDIPLRNVRGNCDRFSPGLDIDEFELEGKRFLMTHGHLFGVKSGKAKIISAATDRGVDILLFGHTHVPFHSVVGDLTIINPGSIHSDGKYYATLEIKNGIVSCELKSLQM